MQVDQAQVLNWVFIGYERSRLCIYFIIVYRLTCNWFILGMHVLCKAYIGHSRSAVWPGGFYFCMHGLHLVCILCGFHFGHTWTTLIIQVVHWVYIGYS